MNISVFLDIIGAGTEISLPPTLEFGLSGGSLVVVVILLALLIYYDVLNVNITVGRSDRRDHLDELLILIVPLLLTFGAYVLFASFQVIE